MGWPGNGDFVGFGWGRGVRGVMLGVGKGLSTVCRSLKVVRRWKCGVRGRFIRWGSVCLDYWYILFYCRKYYSSPLGM